MTNIAAVARNFSIAKAQLKKTNKICKRDGVYCNSRVLSNGYCYIIVYTYTAHVNRMSARHSFRRDLYTILDVYVDPTQRLNVARLI